MNLRFQNSVLGGLENRDFCFLSCENFWNQVDEIKQ